MNPSYLQNFPDLIFSALAGFQEDIVYNRKVQASFDPTTRKPSVTTTTQAVRGIVVGFNKSEIAMSQRAELQLYASDLKIYLKFSDLPFTPTMSDTLTIRGQEWSVLEFQDIEFRNLVYQFTGRRP